MDGKEIEKEPLQAKKPTGRPRTRVIIRSKELAAIAQHQEALTTVLATGPASESDAFDRFAFAVLCVVMKKALEGDMNAARLYFNERRAFQESQAKLKRPAVRVLDATSDASDFGPRSV